jgi:hypothetical protein
MLPPTRGIGHSYSIRPMLSLDVERESCGIDKGSGRSSSLLDAPSHPRPSSGSPTRTVSTAHTHFPTPLLSPRSATILCYQNHIRPELTYAAANKPSNGWFFENFEDNKSNKRPAQSEIRWEQMQAAARSAITELGDATPEEVEVLSEVTICPWGRMLLGYEDWQIDE